MFDKTRNDINKQIQKAKDTHQHYSDLGRKNAQDILRSREDEHKDEYQDPSDIYSQYFKGRRDAFNHTPLWKKIGIILIAAIVVFLILFGWFG